MIGVVGIIFFFVSTFLSNLLLGARREFLGCIFVWLSLVIIVVTRGAWVLVLLSVIVNLVLLMK